MDAVFYSERNCSRSGGLDNIIYEVPKMHSKLVPNRNLDTPRRRHENCSEALRKRRGGILFCSQCPGSSAKCKNETRSFGEILSGPQNIHLHEKFHRFFQPLNRKGCNCKTRLRTRRYLFWSQLMAGSRRVAFIFRDYDCRWLSKFFVEGGWLPERQGVIFAIFKTFRDQALTSQFPNLRAPVRGAWKIAHFSW